MQYSRSKHAKGGKCQDQQLDLAGVDIVDAADLIRPGAEQLKNKRTAGRVNERLANGAVASHWFLRLVSRPRSQSGMQVIRDRHHGDPLVALEQQ